MTIKRTLPVWDSTYFPKMPCGLRPHLIGELLKDNLFTFRDTPQLI